MFGGSDKEYKILTKLSRRRNAITHFGIDDTADYNELTIDLLCTFDVIYNYLYPYLIDLDDVGQYFTSDDIEVETIYGKKPILDDDFFYNNIIGTIDEILVDSSEMVAAKIRAHNPKSKICEFQDIFADLLGDKKFYDMLNNFNIYIKFDENNIADAIKNNLYYFEVRSKDGVVFDEIFSSYSMFYNITYFCNDVGYIYFAIDHENHYLYDYKGCETILPGSDEEEIEDLLIEDNKKGFCRRYNLSKRNLLKAFTTIAERCK